ncbi:MAG: DUF481 domain-containing protein [Thiovulaceae bacterium]|nr:DUF481 domain-containing protein [Sulfurimonadaceae bacterium]
MRLFVFLALFLGMQHSLFALVSIAPVEIGADAGWSAKLGVSLESKRGNTHKDNHKGFLRVAYDENESFVTWGEISGEYGESNEVRDTNKLFSHIRHIHATPLQRINAEAFVQMQDDEFKSLKNRSLAGAGLRYKLHPFLENGTGFLGFGAFHEQIRYSSNVDPHEKNQRLNTYFAYSYAFDPKSKLSYNFYYQPKLDDMNDYINYHAAELKLAIFGTLFLQLSINYEEDKKPAIGVKKYDFTQNTALVLEF